MLFQGGFQLCPETLSLKPLGVPAAAQPKSHQDLESGCAIRWTDNRVEPPPPSASALAPHPRLWKLHPEPSGPPALCIDVFGDQYAAKVREKVVER